MIHYSHVMMTEQAPGPSEGSPRTVRRCIACGARA
jgi:hypothetical protein